jgi:hypothetical protein
MPRQTLASGPERFQRNTNIVRLENSDAGRPPEAEVPQILIQILNDEAQGMSAPIILSEVELELANLAAGAATEAVLGATACGAVSGGNVWGEHAEFSRADWAYEVCNGTTNLGYWSWVYLKKDVADCTADGPKAKTA